MHMYSTTKPISTLVLGHAVLEGRISVDDTVGKFFPNMGDQAHRAITVKQLLQHSGPT
jgi:CubicO group peptidase (beta-lactamase class C family)